jgi:hypothetical protein
MTYNEIANLDAVSPLNFIRNNIPIDRYFEYALLQPSHKEEVADIFTHSFCNFEPMTHFLNMDYKSYRNFALAVTENAIEDGISIVALDKGKVIACALSEDLAQPKPIPLDFDPKFKYIVALLDSLGTHFFQGKQFFRNDIAHLFITAVAEKYQRLGISKQINFRAMDLAAHKGFKQVYCELTNIYNEKGIIPYMTNIKRLIGSCVYHDFCCDGVRPFENLAGGASSYLWEITGNPILQYTENNTKFVLEL